VPSLPKGAYDLLVTRAVQEALAQLPDHLQAEVLDLGAEDVVEYLARLAAERLRVALQSEADDGPETRLNRANEWLSALPEDDPAEARLLRGIRESVSQKTSASVIPLSQSALVTNDQGLNYHQVLRSELLTADRVDMICPFIGNQGLNLILDLLQDLGPDLRVVTTTYLGGTHAQALRRLARHGAQIRIVYERENAKTALHAKAWIFHRDSGFSTATIGSSNLSPRALVDGLEWNVRLGAKDAPHVLRELMVTFDRLWSDPNYEAFDPEKDMDRLDRELKANRQGASAESSFFADLAPKPHQQEGLDSLRYARLDGRNRNLVVAATGTGKTLLAAFDYERWAREQGGRPNLLFVAHRKDILQQSLGAFQAVMRDSSFGELHVGEHRASGMRHLFASVQSLSRMRLEDFAPGHFDYLVVDEFHHAEAPTYESLLRYFQPKQFLGLTATPERADGRNAVLETLMPATYELRLWHALERRLLCPFHYFGIDDQTDLSQVRWTAGKYDGAELESELVDRGEERARIVLRELQEKTEREGLRAVAFCVSQRHADYMAEQFQRAEYSAESLHSGLDKEARERIMSDFRSGKSGKSGKLQIVCTVDLLSEGVDVPEINTVLFLRPTESATVFIQQLGRGLRNHRDKGALTVLDFVGHQRREFRMDLRFRAMTGFTRTEIEHAIRKGFPRLPPGCDIRLDRVTTERVLESLRRAVPSDMTQLAAEYRRITAARGDMPSVGVFLTETGLEPSDLYRSERSLMRVAERAGLYTQELPDLHHRIGSIVHVDDRIRLMAFKTLLEGGAAPESYARMLRYALKKDSLAQEIAPEIAREALELIDNLLAGARSLPLVAEDLPFCLHGFYTRDEIVVPFRERPQAMVAGTFYEKDPGVDFHLSTLRKSEREFSPTTRYHDYFESPTRMHWESQNATGRDTATGRRLLSPDSRHFLFVRETKSDPYLCLGFAKRVWDDGERPIRIRWELDFPVPDHHYVRLAQAAG
jgi:superfamily II DNA or RNA helicase/HKD family nuclease